MQAVFKFILEFESFTGGDGDPDIDDAVGLEANMALARNKGTAIGHLSPAVYRTWHQKGWYNLFNER